MSVSPHRAPRYFSRFLRRRPAQRYIPPRQTIRSGIVLLLLMQSCRRPAKSPVRAQAPQAAFPAPESPSDQTDCFVRPPKRSDRLPFLKDALPQAYRCGAPVPPQVNQNLWRSVMQPAPCAVDAGDPRIRFFQIRMGQIDSDSCHSFFQTNEPASLYHSMLVRWFRKFLSSLYSSPRSCSAAPPVIRSCGRFSRRLFYSIFFLTQYQHRDNADQQSQHRSAKSVRRIGKRHPPLIHVHSINTGNDRRNRHNNRD